MSTILTLHDPQIAREYYAQGVWKNDTFYTLLAGHARTRPDAFALRDSTWRITWKQLLNWVDTLAAELHALGLKRGQRVSVWLPNRAETVVILLACSRNGYICNPSLHNSHTVAEIVQLMERIQTAVLFTQPGFGADGAKGDIGAAAQALPGLKKIYRLDAPGAAGFPAIDTAADPAKLPPFDANPDKIVYLAFTSGTTGMPKGVLHSDNTLLANGRGMVEDWKLDHRTVLYSVSPLSHHIATVALEQTVISGCELVVNDVPSGKSLIDWIIESGATYVMGVPTHAVDILSVMKSRGLNGLGKVKVFYMAGSVIPKATAQAFIDYGITPQNIYGMTENGSHQYTRPTDDVENIMSTCGKPCPGYETRLFDQENPDCEARPGKVGEIGTRGALLMLGYFNNQAATENSFNASGWFLSGDLGLINERGNLQIVGRKKDLIIRGGHNIFPAHIENLAVRHSAVLRAAAFPMADPRLGERVCLAVVLREQASLSAEDMLAHLDREGLSKYDMPEHYICLDAFPLTASGKILKRELVEMTKSNRITPAPVRWTGSDKRDS